MNKPTYYSKHLLTRPSNNHGPTTTKLNSCSKYIEARRLFDKLSKRTSPLYNVMIKYYTQHHQPKLALHLFTEMLTLGQHKPDNFTFPLVFKACSDLSMIKTGETIHCRALMSGYENNEYVQNSLITMYMNCGEMEVGKRVFDIMYEKKTIVSWNSMISGYALNGCVKEALLIFDKMVDKNVGFDPATAVSVLPACASLKDLRRGRLVHELVKRNGIGDCVAVWNSLVDMYAKCGCLNEARSVFNEIVERDVVSWTAMVGGYVLNGDARGALALCFPMQLDEIIPNSVTVVNLLSACLSLSDLKCGKCIQGWVTRCGLESDVLVETSLIDLYAKNNRMDLSLRVFRKTSRKRTVPWNAIISGYVYNRLGKDAIEIFKQMHVEMVASDCATLISLLPAYADMADLQMAKNIHCYLLKSGSYPRTETSTGLIDIYSKCGSLEFAQELFNGIPEEDKDIVTWSAIIAGYGMHGHGEVAISFFDQMVQAGIKPNEVTFTSVLHACSHAGLVDEGLRLFKSMVVDHQGTPCTDHYTCIIDLVGRAGRLKEAYELIKSMPLKPNHAVWGALLGACVIHQEVELGQVAANWLFELEPDNTGNYILMSKLYSAVGRWEDAENVRMRINDKKLRKTPGCSSVGVRVRLSFLSLISVHVISQLCPVLPSAPLSLTVLKVVHAQAVAPFPSILELQNIQASSLLYVDQPTGTGFSYSSNSCNLRHNEEGVSYDLYNAVFHNTRESYAGHYIPAFAACVYQGNKAKEGIQINLKKGHTDYALDVALVKAKEGSINKILEACELAIKRCDVGFDEYTVGALLSACSVLNGYKARKQIHVLIYKNLKLGIVMVSWIPCSDVHRIKPHVEQYFCMVYPFGGSGHVKELKEAYDFIKKMPFVANSLIWRSLLGSWKSRNNEIGDRAAGRLFKVDPARGAPYGVIYHAYLCKQMGRCWKSINLLYIDHPAGTGFNYSLNSPDLRHNEEGVSNHLYAFFQAFVTDEHLQFAKNDFYFSGESDAGHYIPAFAGLLLLFAKGRALQLALDLLILLSSTKHNDFH
ncbi:hypothetical protein IFM89_016330 [Coptis chinensis]|uniref:Pentatricopeptide repeat-containing protein n=1 Tax=Coptis chinensis TaxID=261450 RepID=A0A835LMS7_9MAGN|nr:hypothetical protein IFM89_016330 [Coptis chinensis]